MSSNDKCRFAGRDGGPSPRNRACRSWRRDVTSCSSPIISRNMPKCASAIAAIFRQPRHQFCRHHFRARASSSCCSRKFRRLGGLAFRRSLFLYGFSLIPYGFFNIISLNLYEFGNNYIIEGKFDRVLLPPGIVAVSGSVRDFPHRVRAGNRHRHCSACSGASRQLHIPWTPAKVAHASFLRHLRRHHLCFGFLDAHHASRSGSKIASACIPPVWNMIAFGRYPLSIYSGVGAIFPVLDHSLRPRLVLSQRAPAGPHRVARIRAARSGSRRRIPHLAISLWNIGTRHYSSTGS